ncbi:MAG: carbon storage regulator CsrA [Thermodesulfobacteria bacterium]|nr:carbon storage regulator CsrA [Thermodesulfobacteriota bacterium]
MLVLTRKIGESITIGHEIRIIVLDIKGRQVKLGIEAPPHIPVHRLEVYRKIQEENIRAAEASQLPDELFAPQEEG